MTTLLLAKVRQQSLIAIAVALSGIAATLLTGGRTAHSSFKLPFNLATKDTPICNISKGTGTAQVLQNCQLIVWDECTMSHKAAFEAVDQTLQDICGNNKIMGGVTLVLADDFWQTLPVIPRGKWVDELKASVKSSYLWRNVKKLSLSTNMRVHQLGDQSSRAFANKLLILGNSNVATDSEGSFDMNPIAMIVESEDELQTKVYPNLSQLYKDQQWLCERAILAPKKMTVNSLNVQLSQRLPGNGHEYRSIDAVIEQDQTVNYPEEFLNSLYIPGIPPHPLPLKVGVPVMLIRNMDSPTLCTGTRLVLNKLMPHILEATIITGIGKVEDVLILCIPIIPSD